MAAECHCPWEACYFYFKKVIYTLISKYFLNIDILTPPYDISGATVF